MFGKKLKKEIADVEALIEEHGKEFFLEMKRKMDEGEELSEKEVEVMEEFEKEFLEAQLEMMKHEGKKPEAIEREEVIEGAKLEAKERKEKGPDHCHSLMNPEYKLNLLEISHRTIEEIERARYRIMGKYQGEEAVQKFKDFIFDKLIGK